MMNEADSPNPLVLVSGASSGVAGLLTGQILVSQDKRLG